MEKFGFVSYRTYNGKWIVHISLDSKRFLFSIFLNKFHVLNIIQRPTLRSQVVFSNKLLGFKSLCNTLAVKENEKFVKMEMEMEIRK